MASNDLKIASYSIPVDKSHQAYTIFLQMNIWNSYVCEIDKDQPCEYLQKF